MGHRQRGEQPKTTAHQAMFCLGLTLSAGCDGCSDKHPFTPFSVETSSTAAGTGAGGGTNTSAFDAVRATVTPREAKIPWGNATANAPNGRVFLQELTADGTGDGTADLFALLESRTGDVAELWYLDGKDGTTNTLVTFPADLTHAGCKRDVVLTWAAANAITLKVSAACPEGDAIAFVAAVRLGEPSAPAAPEVRFTARTRGKNGDGESLDLQIDLKDRDSDARADLAVEVIHGGMPAPFVLREKISLPMLYLSRPAGYARDPMEPEATLNKLALTLVAQAKDKKRAPQIFDDVAHLLHVTKLVCSSAPRIETSSGAPACGDGHHVFDAVFAVGQAGITSTDLPLAIAAYDVLAKAGEPAKKRRADLERLLSVAAPTVEPALVAKAPLDLASGGVFLPLAFDGDGAVLVMKQNEVVKLVGNMFEKAEAVAWPLGLAWNARSTQFEIAGLKCAPSPSLEGRVGGTPTSFELPLLDALVGGGCVNHRLTAISTGTDGAVVAVGANLLKLAPDGSALKATRTALPEGGPPAVPGAIRATDGSATVIVSSSGVYLLGAIPSTSAKKKSRAVTLKREELKGAEACVVRTGGTRVACTTPTGVVVVDVAP